jgi:DNA polymerase (family 10)
LGKRPGVEANWEEIAKFCVAHNKFLEINASPERADLPYDIVRNCRKVGVKFIVNTDSHHEHGLLMMKFGVWTARKGWLTASDVVNAGADGVRLLQKV